MAKKKRWATHVTLDDGRRIYVSAGTKRELAEKTAEVRKDAEAGVDVTDRTTLGDYARTWLEVYKRPKVKPRTYEKTEAYVLRRIIPGLGAMELKKIRQIHIRQFLAGLDIGETAAIKTESILRAILRTAVDNGLIARSPMPEKMISDPHETPEKEPLSNDQALRLLRSVRAEPDLYLFCLIALSCGMRKGEIVGLRWEHVDLDGSIIHVRRSRGWDAKSRVVDTDTTKTSSGQRDLPIPAPLKAALMEARAASPDSKFVFPGRAKDGGMGEGDFSAWDRMIERRTPGPGREFGRVFPARAYGGRKHPAYVVDLDFRVTPHILRHTYITQLFEAGLDIKQVQYLAGHKSPDITLGIYTHYRAKDRGADTVAKVQAATGYLATGTDGRTVIPFPGEAQED